MTKVEKKKSINKEKKPKKSIKKKSKIAAKTERKDLIESTLMEQLINQRKVAEFYEDLIRDYMFYYDLKEKMQRDIEKRGLVITVTTGNGFAKKGVNENVKELRETSKMMLKILQDLGLQEIVVDEAEETDLY